MAGDRVVRILRVAASEDDRAGHAVARARFQHHSITIRKPVEGQPQPPEQVLAVGIRAGKVEDQVRGGVVESGRERALQFPRVVLVGAPIAERDIDVARWFDGRVAIGLMEGNRRDVRVVSEYERRPVAVVDVAIDDHGRLDRPPLSEHADGNGDVIDETESFGVIGKRMVKPSVQIQRAPVLVSKFARQNRATGSKPESIH